MTFAAAFAKFSEWFFGAPAARRYRRKSGSASEASSWSGLRGALMAY